MTVVITIINCRLKCVDKPMKVKINKSLRMLTKKLKTTLCHVGYDVHLAY